MTTEINEQHSEMIITAKKLFPLAIKSSLTITVCSIFFIWFYLSSLGRLDVFIDTISFHTLLGIVFSFTLVTFFLFCIFVYTPSLILSMIIYEKEKKLLNKKAATHSLIKITFINSILVAITLTVGIYFHYVMKEHKEIINYSIITTVLLQSFIITYWELYESKFSQIKNRKIKVKKKAYISLSLILMIPSLIQLILSLAFLSKATFGSHTPDFIQLLIICLLLIALSLISLLPGMQFITTRKTNILGNVVLTGMLSTFSFFSLTFFFPNIPIIISNSAMSLAGISDNRTHQYIIKNEIYSASMFPSQQWNTRYYPDIPGRFFITGMTIFSFGNIRLICPTSINKARLESLLFNPDTPGENKERNESLKSAAMPCFPIDKEDIKQWDSPLSDPIFYEKVRLTTPHSPTDIFQYLQKK
ncbi:hypothetical protein V6M93_21440 [Pectobacterium brasiliense]|uniref:hypothetical protein n=1 Tax=Pectobacterium brasiliense TaxID=180957 RepID=UPI0036733DB9